MPLTAEQALPTPGSLGGQPALASGAADASTGLDPSPGFGASASVEVSPVVAASASATLPPASFMLPVEPQAARHAAAMTGASKQRKTKVKGDGRIEKSSTALVGGPRVQQPDSEGSSI
jgi:hypothetical protein